MVSVSCNVVGEECYSDCAVWFSTLVLLLLHEAHVLLAGLYSSDIGLFYTCLKMLPEVKYNVRICVGSAFLCLDD